MLLAMRQVLILSSLLAIAANTVDPQTESWKISTTQFVVGAGEVVMTLQMFLLIRKGKTIGAIRFTSVEQGHTLCAGRANYESYLQNDGSGSFRSPGIRKRIGDINVKSLKGIGRLAFQLGNDKVKIGSWTFASGCPGSLDMWPYRGEQKDYGYEFAPTSAQSVDEIDAFDPRLKWFRFDPNSRVRLSVSELPK